MSLFCRDSASPLVCNCVELPGRLECTLFAPLARPVRLTEKWRSAVARMLSPLLVVITCLFGATSAWSSTPRDELHTHIEELLNIAENPSFTDEERAVHARTTVRNMFDFSDTARRAFGPH